MSEAAESPPKGPGWARSRTGTAVIAVAAVAVIFIMIIAVVLSPSMSPLASVHDADGDGYVDSVDEFPDDGSEWNDLDGDGVGDNADEFPDDADETSDSDSDGVGDNSDPFPEDSSEWMDTDEDGVGDNSDEFPEDADESSDADGDGVGDNSDDFPDDDTEWSDSDGDGVGDNSDPFPDDEDKDSPEVLFSMEIMIDGVMVMFEAVAPEFEWDDLMVTFGTDSDTAVWEFENEDLDGWEPATTKVYDSYDIGGTRVYLVAIDLTGDGLVSAFDGFMIYPENESFDPYTEYTLVISYEPTGHELEDLTFSFDQMTTPVTTLSDEPITNGLKITFGAVSQDVSWSEVSFLLGDGTYYGGWSNLTADMLDDGLGDTQVMQTVTLGTLVVTFSVTDLSGNGEVNQGDYIKLTATSFSAVTDYTFVVIYEPTDGLMGECTFTG